MHHKTTFIHSSPVLKPHLGGAVVSVLGSWHGGCAFDNQLRRNFFPTYFRLLPLLKHVRKVDSGFGKKFVLVLVWESQETMCVTDCHDMTLAVKVALNLNTTNNCFEKDKYESFKI